MFRYLSPIALTLWATCSTAAIQNSDFWFHNDGDIVFIDGQRGAPREMVNCCVSEQV